MKTSLRSMVKTGRGFTLIELLIVIMILSTLLALAGIPAKQWMDRYNMEGELRKMRADLLQARVWAMERNRRYVVEVTAPFTYRGCEDVNNNNVCDAGEPPLWTAQKTLRYVSAKANIRLIFDQRGIVTNPSATLANAMPDLTFDTGAATPEFDCIQFYPTRINLGKMNGGNCVPR